MLRWGWGQRAGGWVGATDTPPHVGGVRQGSVWQKVGKKKSLPGVSVDFRGGRRVVGRPLGEGEVVVGGCKKKTHKWVKKMGTRLRAHAHTRTRPTTGEEGPCPWMEVRVWPSLGRNSHPLRGAPKKTILSPPAPAGSDTEGGFWCGGGGIAAGRAEASPGVSTSVGGTTDAEIKAVFRGPTPPTLPPTCSFWLGVFASGGGGIQLEPVSMSSVTGGAARGAKR